ncbi:MAG: hypothetical protein COC06_12100 [Bacteroidales bacterium]|nr:MAG: hypothetical protein COC06_12100 [Bacteroidales bacterium]
MIVNVLYAYFNKFKQLLRQCQVTFASGLFTKSAFVQYRKKINADVFKKLSDNLIDEFYTDNEESVTLWCGFRLLIIGQSLK